MNVLILGSKGQLGRSLADTAPASATLTLASRNEIDLLALNELHAKLESVAPDAIINAIAFRNHGEIGYGTTGITPQSFLQFVEVGLFVGC